MSKTLASGLDGAAVNLHECSHQAQSNAQPTPGSGQRLVRLAKEVKNVGQEIQSNPDAGVLDADDDQVSVAIALAGHPDGSPGFGVLGCIGQEVAEDLSQSDPIGIEDDPGGGIEREEEIVPTFRNQRSGVSE